MDTGGTVERILRRVLDMRAGENDESLILYFPHTKTRDTEQSCSGAYSVVTVGGTAEQLFRRATSNSLLKLAMMSSLFVSSLALDSASLGNFFLK